MTVHVGGYPSYGPPTSSLAAAVVEGLAESPLVAGLELPLADGELALPSARLPSVWRHVVTLMPSTVASTSSDPAWGPASEQRAGRDAAVALLQSVRDVVARRSDILAVELQSAPRRTGSAAAFADSLAEIASWDWNGVGLVVEHCDAWTTAHDVAKGFLSQAAELDVIAALQGAETRVSGGVNWARSVIETRDVATGAAHVRAAAARGLLGAVMFSSVADRETALGPAWADVHLAPTRTTGAAAGSLLTPELILEALAAAGPSDAIIGLKVNLGPGVLSPAQQVARLLEIAAFVAA